MKIEVIEVKGGGFLKVTGSENQAQIGFKAPTSEFEITAMDADGDTASITLTVDDSDRPQIIPGEKIQVKESGPKNGSDPDDDAISGTGSFTVENKGLAGILTIVGISAKALPNAGN